MQTTTPYNTLQHILTRCNTLQYIAKHCNSDESKVANVSIPSPTILSAIFCSVTDIPSTSSTSSRTMTCSLRCAGPAYMQKEIGRGSERESVCEREKETYMDVEKARERKRESVCVQRN